MHHKYWKGQVTVSAGQWSWPVSHVDGVGRRFEHTVGAKIICLHICWVGRCDILQVWADFPHILYGPQAGLCMTVELASVAPGVYVPLF